MNCVAASTAFAEEQSKSEYTYGTNSRCDARAEQVTSECRAQATAVGGRDRQSAS